MKISINITDNKFTMSTKEEMWNIYKAYYHCSKDDFMKRIETNNQFAIYKHEGNIVGFTGLKINRTRIGEKSNLLIYFGQTVIEKEFRGNALLPLTCFKIWLKYFKDFLTSDIYFWYDALTYKSYLVGVKTMEECYPSRKQQTPQSIKNLINYIGQQHYQESFCSELGTVLKSKIFVSDPSISIGNNEKKDADIQFFMKANPNYRKGHGLIILTPGSKKNLVKLVKRVATNIFNNFEHNSIQLIQSLKLQLTKFTGLDASS